jgi:hypothetical protein
MVKNILLTLDDDKFRQLKLMKASWESGKKTDFTWEEFLVDWVIMWHNMIAEKTLDKTIEEATKHIKAEYRDDLVKTVKAVVADKLRMYH